MFGENLGHCVPLFVNHLSWFRFSRPVCSIPNVSLDVLVSAKIQDPGEVTCASWIGKRISPYLLATGHMSGDVLTWSMPEELRGFTDRKRMTIPHIVHRFLARPDLSLGNQITSISYISGTEDQILVFGGQSLEEPAGLSLFSLSRNRQEEESGHELTTAPRLSLAWFGNILDFELVPPKGSMEQFDDPLGVLVLTEDGNLVVHDLHLKQPIPFSMPFQICHKQCSASLSIKPLVSSPLVQFLASVEDQSAELMEDIGGIFDQAYTWILAGGTAAMSIGGSNARHPLLVLGYEDGRIRFWSLLKPSPLCLYLLDLAEDFSTAAVKSLEILDDGTFLVVGNAKGHVLVYQISDVPRTVKVRKFNGPGQPPEIEEQKQRAGYQLLICLSLNSNSIQRITFHPESHFLAALDSSGDICVINLITLECVFIPFASLRSQHSIVDVAFCEAPLSPREQESPVEVILFVADEASNLAAVDPTSGTMMKESDWLHPKNESKTVQLMTLDENGFCPVISSIQLGGSDAFFWTPVDTPDEDISHSTESLQRKTLRRTPFYSLS